MNLKNNLIRYTSDGLIPAIAQQYDTGEVLMMAWMNAESLAQTLETGKATYWSRSRASLWCKGETSGHHQLVREVRVDCDGDTLLLIVDQIGSACHNYTRTCFSRVLEAQDMDEGYFPSKHPQ